jgi:hypothetical protein
MPKNSSSKEIPDDEIDLLDLFKRFGRAIAKGFKAIGDGLLILLFFLVKNLLPLLASIVLGIGLSYILKWSTKPFYNSEITLRSNAVPNSEMISHLNKLNLLLKEKNFDAVANALSIPKEKALTIRDIKALWVIDKNRDGIPDYVDYRNKHNVYDTIDVRMEDRFIVKVRVSSPMIFQVLKDGIFMYINNDNIFKIRNDSRLKRTDELLERLNYDIKQLDSLQKIKYYEETKNMQPKNGGQMVFLQEQKTQLVYEDIYNLYGRKQILDQEKDVYPDIATVISDFYQPLKRFNGGFYYGKVVIPVLFALMFIFLVLNRNKKRLKEIYKKY